MVFSSGGLGALPSLDGPAGSRALPGSPAGVMRRCAAVAVDLPVAVAAVLGPLLALDRVLEVLAVADDPARTIWRTSAVLWLLGFPLTCSPVCVTRPGGTPGKRVMGIEVVRAGDGARLRYGQAVLRHRTDPVANAVPLFLVAHISAMTLHPRHQGMHDKAADSVVVRRRSPAVRSARGRASRVRRA